MKNSTVNFYNETYYGSPKETFNMFTHKVEAIFEAFKNGSLIKPQEISLETPIAMQKVGVTGTSIIIEITKNGKIESPSQAPESK